MSEGSVLPVLAAVVAVLVHLAVILRAVLRPHREPASRIAWVIVILVLPVVGVGAYILLGETNIGRKRVARMRGVLAALPDVSQTPGWTDEVYRPDLPERYTPLFQAGRSVNDFQPVGGNQAQLMTDSNSTIDALVADIDAAEDHVHLNFYIWLADNNGLKVVAAMIRAATRGVTCRALADGLGSRLIIGSKHWKAMRDAGVRIASALPIGNPLIRSLRGRVDLRNHRKIVVIDNHITYCGSQNCADPEFRIKAKYAPWIDAMIRFEGPVARQNQHLFASDWMAQVDDDITDLLREPLPPGEPGVVAQVIGSGPTVRYSAMPDVFETLIFAARRELFVTTPYYVPNESMQAALCACAHRGVETTIIFPARNDSWVVGAASRSYYEELLTAGVRVFEYEAGVLHTKSLTLDGEVTLIGSANMDRRSFELNFENNILLYDAGLTGEVRQRQEDYLADSRAVDADRVAQWSMRHRLWNNAIAMLGPVL